VPSFFGDSQSQRTCEIACHRLGSAFPWFSNVTEASDLHFLKVALSICQTDARRTIPNSPKNLVASSCELFVRRSTQSSIQFNH
jgi:hypothetical protein